MMRRPPRCNAGFTLVETLVAGSILISMALMTMLWLTGVSNLWWTSTTQSQARATAQQAVSRMMSELRSATRTGSPAAPGISIAAGNASMTFYLPTDIDGDGTIINAATGATEWDQVNSIQYTLDVPSQQLRRTWAGQTVVLANNVSSVRFDDQSTDATLFQNEVKISLTVSPRTPQGRTVSATSAEIVKVRN